MADEKDSIVFVVWAQVERIETKPGGAVVYDNVGSPDSLYETKDAEDARAFMEILKTFDLDERQMEANAEAAAEQAGE